MDDKEKYPDPYPMVSAATEADWHNINSIRAAVSFAGYGLLEQGRNANGEYEVYPNGLMWMRRADGVEKGGRWF